MRAARVWALALALVFLAGHLPFLSPGLEDIDSLNFALGLRDFDPTRHQPHPPGYPLFIALGKLARAIGLSEAHALAIWGPLFGAIAIFALVQLFRAIDGVERRVPDNGETSRAALATGLTAICPLFWFTAVRPMSDVPGLAVALAAQALVATAFWRQREMQPGDRAGLAASGRLIVLGSFAAALALGFRSQTIWLTAPPLMLVILHRVGRGAAGAILGASIVFALGVVLWAVPMLVASGGLRAYLGALGSQAGEDFSGVDLLIRNPTARGLAAAVVNTLVLPWSSTALASVAVALAIIGLGVMLARARMSLLLLIVLAQPYAVFHLLFQETVTTRYALPLAPAVSYLIVRGLSLTGRHIGLSGVVVLAVWAAWVAVPAVSIYARQPSPIVRALSDVTAATPAAAQEPAVGMHYVFARAAQVAPLRNRLLEAGPKHEWLAAARYWLDGGGRTVWFLADPTRTDLTLIDPTSRGVRGSYLWSPELTVLLSGVRPSPVDWVEITDPGWFLTQGWDITPETAGVARLDGIRPGRTPIVGYLRHRPGAVILLVGGRNLNPTPGVRATITVSIDGHMTATLIAPSDPGFFVRILDLPAGTLSGPGYYARLDVTAASLGGVGPPNVGIEQFNLQPIESVAWGFDTGWHEQEFNPATGRVWRWTSDRAETIVHHGGADLVLALAGESPLHYFDRPARLTVRAGHQVLAQEQLSNDFELNVRVPAAALQPAGDRLTLEADETFVPAERSENADRRRLGLRIWKFELREAQP